MSFYSGALRAPGGDALLFGWRGSASASGKKEGRSASRNRLDLLGGDTTPLVANYDRSAVTLSELYDVKSDGLYDRNLDGNNYAMVAFIAFETKRSFRIASPLRPAFSRSTGCSTILGVAQPAFVSKFSVHLANESIELRCVGVCAKEASDLIESRGGFSKLP